MDEFAKKVEKLKAKSELLLEFTSLYLRKKEIVPQILEAQGMIQTISEEVKMCDNLAKNYMNSAYNEYEKLTTEMREQQLVMLNIMKIIKERRSLETVSAAAAPLREKNDAVFSPIRKEKFLSEVGTPSMFLKEYKQSPLVNRMRSIALQFLDFDINITQEMFATVPSYMRGRETIESIQNFFASIIVPCFTEKYQLIYKKRDCIKNPADVELWRNYNYQASIFPGQKFITQEDLLRKLDQKTIDKKNCARLTIFRHIGILREERTHSLVCYLWCFN